MGFDKLMQPPYKKGAGKPVLQHSIECLLANSSIKHLIIVTPQERFKALDLSPSQLKLITRIDGGDSRQASVQAALNHLNSADNLPTSKSILIHDGARPLLSPTDLNAVITAHSNYPAVSLATQVTDTIKQQDKSGNTQSIDRESLWAMQTPQLFDTQLITQAYQQAQQSNLALTDEISAIERLGKPVHFISAQNINLKLTTPQDLQLAQAWLDATCS